MSKKSKYTVDESFVTYKEVAKIATEDGYKMNTATARHIFYKGMEKLAASLLETEGFSHSEAKEKAKTVAKSVDFQILIRDIMDGNFFND